MEKQHALLTAAALFVIVVTSLFLSPLIGGLALATTVLAAVPGKKEEIGGMKLKVNENGEIVFESQAQLDEFAASVAEAGAKNIIKIMGLDKIPAPPGAPAPEDVKALAVEPSNETRGAKLKRLDKAIVEVRGGRLAVEDAPKEIKMNRWLAGLYDGNREVVKALGPGSYSEARIKTLTQGSATDGGNLVPVEFDTALLVAMEEYGVCEKDCLIVEMTSNEKDLRTVTTKPAVTRKGELIASVEAATKFGKPQLTCDVVTGHQIISREEMDDNNVGLFQKLVDLFAEQLAYTKDYDGLAGSYYTSPLNNFANTTVTTLDSTSILDITYKKLVAMSRSLSPGKLARGGKWYMHRTTLGVIESLVDDHGRPLISSAFSPLGPTLLGYPVALSEAMPGIASDAANTAFIIFGNLTWVAFGRRAGITTQILREATITNVSAVAVNLA